jgi:hypothetical protein
VTHDQHFLSRLDRLDGGHAEIALGLYYDSALVQHILKVANIPDEVDRVALALGGPEDDGPHLIVARDGHFVTCLGEGMQLQEGQPVVSRHRLDTISGSVESLRSLLADAGAGGRRQTTRALERVSRAGSHLSQDEFEEAARWLPLLALQFLSSHMATVERCHQLYEHLRRHKKYKRRHHELLHDYWRSSWKIAHLTMLLGSDGGATLRVLVERLEAELSGVALQLPWCLIRLGVSSFAGRGAWVASKLPTYVVPEAKRRYVDDEATFLTTMTDSLSLAAVGMRHRRYQAEVGKTLAKDSLADDPLVNAIHHLASAYFEHHCTDPQMFLNHTIDISRRFLRALYSHLPQDKIDALDEVPSDAAVALFMNLPHAFHGDTGIMKNLFERLPWIVNAEAKSFYLPEPYAIFGRTPWTPEESVLLLDGRKGDDLIPLAPIVREGPKIGRNAPCPCGSGNKYKRCCAT